MGVSKVAVSPIVIQEALFDSKTDNPVRIIGAAWDGLSDVLILTIEGQAVPDVQRCDAVCTKQREITIKFVPL